MAKTVKERLADKGLVPSDDQAMEYAEKLFEMALKAIEKIKAQIQEVIDAKGVEVEATANGLQDRLNGLSETLESFRDETLSKDYKHIESRDTLSKELRNELQKISDSIPTMPDLSYLEERIEDVEAKIPKIPEPTPADTGEDIIEKINALDTKNSKNKIDAKHIKNLPKGGGSVGMAYPTAGQNIAVNGRTVSLRIPIQSTAPSNPILNDLWIDNS